jgi:Hypoxia induced protein conserved region
MTIMSNNNPLPSSFDGDKYVHPIAMFYYDLPIYPIIHRPSITNPLPSEFYEESRLQKFTRRLKEEPLIPFGCLITCAALLGATRSIRQGDHNKTNRMFRARIYAQGFTLVAMVVGSFYWDTDRRKRKEFEGVLADKKAKEKNEAWIRELEARDQEEREARAARERRRGGGGSAGIGGMGGAASMVDERERRRGTLEMVSELVYGRK